MDEDSEPEPSFYASEKFLIYYLLRYLQQYSEDFDNYLEFVFIKYSHCIYMLELLKNMDINKWDISDYIGDIDISKYFSKSLKPKSLKPHDELYAYFRLLRALTYIIEDRETMSIIVQEIIDVLDEIDESDNNNNQIQLEKTINNEFDLLNKQSNTQVLKEFDFIIKSIYAYDSEPIVPMPTGIEVARVAEVAGGRINNNNMTNKLKVKKQANKKRHYKSKKQKNRRKSTLREKKQRKYKSRKHKSH
jgi:hypothetical protein